MITVRPKHGNPNFEELFVAAAAHPSASGNGGEEEDDDNGAMQEDEYGFYRDAQIGVSVPGLSLGDSEDPPLQTGLSQEALAHLSRQVKTLTDPVLMFVAEVAATAGTSLNHMMVNPSLPLVNTEAPSINTLLSSSQFPRDLLLVVLARVLLDTPSLSVSQQQQASATATGTVTTAATAKQPGTPPKSGSLSSDASATPPFKASNAPIGDTIREYIETLAPVGVNPFSRRAGQSLVQQQQQQGQPTSEQVLYDVLSNMQGRSEVLDWTWSQMPEQSGLAVIRPEVTSVIQSCFESIRALSESHRRIKLWHLITGPMVRHKFARLVGSLLNTTPGEMQYPGFTSVRRNGAVTGSRVTPGITSQAQHSRVYVKLLAWFKHVTYREAEEYVQVNQRLAGSRETTRMAMSELNRARADMVESARAIWEKLDPAIKEHAADLWFAENMDKGPRNEVLNDSLRKKLKEGSARGSIGAAAATDIYFLTPLAGPIQPATRVFLTPRSMRMPSVPPPREVIELPENTEPEQLVKILTAALGALERIGKRVQNPDDMDAVFTLSLRINIMMSALTNMRRVIEQSFADRKLAASFDETRRIELVYRAPLPSRERPPLRNFLY